MIDEIEDALNDVYCNQQLNFVGLVQFTKSRVNDEMVEVLRKVTESMNFQPIVYDGTPLAFVIITDEIQINSFRSGTFECLLVVLSGDYLDHKLIIRKLGGYEFNTMTLNTNSQQIYNTYFQQDENKPFSDFAFSLRLQVRDNFA